MATITFFVFKDSEVWDFPGGPEVKNSPSNGGDTCLRGSPGGSDGEESVCNAGDLGSISRSGRFPGEGNGYPLQSVFLPREFHGQRSLVGRKESVY